MVVALVQIKTIAPNVRAWFLWYLFQFFAFFRGVSGWINAIFYVLSFLFKILLFFKRCMTMNEGFFFYSEIWCVDMMLSKVLKAIIVTKLLSVYYFRILLTRDRISLIPYLLNVLRCNKRKMIEFLMSKPKSGLLLHGRRANDECTTWTTWLVNYARHWWYQFHFKIYLPTFWN